MRQETFTYFEKTIFIPLYIKAPFLGTSTALQIFVCLFVVLFVSALVVCISCIVLSFPRALGSSDGVTAIQSSCGFGLLPAGSVEGAGKQFVMNIKPCLDKPQTRATKITI